MQHYGAPSRLLDWAHNPYIALYFACEQLPDKDGAFILMAMGNLQSSQYIDHHKEMLSKPGTYSRRNDKTFFLQLHNSLLGKEYTPYIFTIADPEPTARMLGQHSEFSITTEILEPHDIIADRIMYGHVKGGGNFSTMQKGIVPKELKEEFLSRLDKEKGINFHTIFPDYDKENGLDAAGNLTKNYAYKLLDEFIE